MSDGTNRNSRPSVPPPEEGILANLPRTRPQRSSPRRTAARKAAAGAGKSTANETRVDRSPRAAGEPSRRRIRSAGRADAAPRQGFESDGESMSGSVQPPGGTELVATAAELVGELAKAGLSTGERLLKDVLARLPLS